MYSATINGKVCDFTYKELQKDHHAFYVGNILVGQIFKMKRSWSAVSQFPNTICPIHGFKSRYYACEFLLKLCGIW